MATQGTAAAQKVVASESLSGPQTIRIETRKITSNEIYHFVEATGDNNEIHLLDHVATQYGLVRRCAHGKLVQAVAVDLIRLKEAQLGNLPAIIEDTWRHPCYVYVDEEVCVKYSRSSKLGLNFITAIVYVERAGQEVVVATGKITAKLLNPQR